MNVVDELEYSACPTYSSQLDECLNGVAIPRRFPTAVPARVTGEHLNSLCNRLFADSGHIKVFVVVADVYDCLFPARLLPQPLGERAL